MEALFICLLWVSRFNGLAHWPVLVATIVSQLRIETALRIWTWAIDYKLITDLALKGRINWNVVIATLNFKAPAWSNHLRTYAVSSASFHNFKSQNFKLSVSNPKSKYVACLSVLSRISNCQGLGRKNRFEIMKTDRSLIQLVDPTDSHPIDQGQTKYDWLQLIADNNKRR